MKAWLEWEGGRLELRPGLNTVGGPGAMIPVEGSESDSLHVWDDPPRLVFVGQGQRPRVNGREVEETELRSGDAIEWHGTRVMLRGDGGQASLEPIALEPAAARSPAPPIPGSGGATPVWRRLKAGLLVESGLADKRTAKRWQDAVRRGEFDADACTRDLLGATGDQSGVDDEDPRLQERSARLLRDLLMAPVLRGLSGARRRAREAARGGLAFLVAQLLVLAIYSLIVLVVLLLVRVRWEASIDGFLDGIRDLF